MHKVCNNFKKPARATGENSARIHLLNIEWRISGVTHSGIMGASSGEDDEENMLM